jgi:pyroglutamyl-peptidase
MAILITAFEPFGGATVNTSWEVAQLLAAQDSRIHVVQLPVVRGAAEEKALAAVKSLAPTLYLALGEAGAEPVVRLEKVAVNWDDFRIPDNAGNQPRNAAIRTGAPDAYFATLPVAAIAEALRDKTPLPVVVSLSAGAFLCNHLAYAVLDAGVACPFAFVHVPNERDPARWGAIVQTVAALCDYCVA